MLSPKSEIFLKEILTYVKFAYDRTEIRIELESHLSDKIEYYMEQGYDTETSEEFSIHDMGDAKEIGMELNKQHNPILGWLWRITNVIASLLIIIFCFIFILFNSSLFQGNLIDTISKSEIVYKIDLKERVKIDDRVIRFTNVIYEKNGDMNIFYESYTLGGAWWNFGYLGEISDDLGNKYMSSSGQQSGGFISKGVLTLDQFSKAADRLIISYDRYNRKYRVEIPLKEGGNNE